ncbi:MAG: hypothetical protein ACR2PL_17985 [Dehalococcoidia bacterium]
MTIRRERAEALAWATTGGRETHTSWLAFVEAWFAILSKTCRKRSEFATAAVAEQAILGFITTSNTDQAHPFTWRQRVPFFQRLKDKLAAATASNAAGYG